MQTHCNPSNKTILIVEDEPDTAEMLAEMMRLCGYRVLHSYNGKKVINTLLNHTLEAVLLDVILPDQSGIEVLQSIRRDPRLESIPVVIVSANNHQSDIQRGMIAGASAYLSKPIGFWEIKDTLERVTRKPAFPTAMPFN